MEPQKKRIRSVRETIAQGISTLEQLQEALGTAMQLEFSTIPPYLCAEWSIKSDPSNVGTQIHGIVIQEMYHLGLAANMLVGINGTTAFNQPTFVPAFPTNGLPGGVWPGLAVNLAPLTHTSLLSFMQIEFPEDALIVVAPDSIGAFYDTIAAGFQTVQPVFGSNPQVTASLGQDQLTPITSISQAVDAINTIKTQGEGTSGSPDETDGELAHYYTFSQIYYGAKLVKVGDIWQYTGDPITLPTVFPFTNTGAPTPPFSSTFSTLMGQLQKSWSGSPNTINDAIGTMFDLQSTGVGLIQAGTCPQFTL